KRRLENKVWIFFFLKFWGDASPIEECKYLLYWITIDFMDVKDVSELNDEVRSNMTDLNQAVANSLGVDEEIIIPVDNILLVEDLERELEDERRENELLRAEAGEMERIIAEMKRRSEERERIIAEMKRRSEERERIIAEMKRENAEMKREIAEMKKILEGLAHRNPMHQDDK
ncbi:MAG: hypothetical protein ACTSVI_03755, partial [Promethearchaeota archaeon]